MLRPVPKPLPALAGAPHAAAVQRRPPEVSRPELALLFLLSILAHALLVRWVPGPPRIAPVLPMKPLHIELLAAAPPPPVKAPAPAARPLPPVPRPRPPLAVKRVPPRPIPKPRPLPPRHIAKPHPQPRRAEPRPVRRVTAPKLPPRPASPAAPRPVTPPSPAPAPAPFVQASFDAAYLHNPAPDYPPQARMMGLQGRVELEVEVLPSGRPGKVRIEHSSGESILDRAAVNAVKRWRFVPARRGATAVTSTVIVPIVFKLE